MMWRCWGLTWQSRRRPGSLSTVIRAAEKVPYIVVNRQPSELTAPTQARELGPALTLAPATPQVAIGPLFQGSWDPARTHCGC
jgi:hypothetical protein